MLPQNHVALGGSTPAEQGHMTTLSTEQCSDDRALSADQACTQILTRQASYKRDDGVDERGSPQQLATRERRHLRPATLAVPRR